MIKGICFDMDGVLVDTEHLGTGILIEAAACQGCQLTDEHWHALIGVNMKDTKVRLAQWFGTSIDPERFVSDWCALMLEHVDRDGLPMKPWADETLHSLKAHGYGLALCTSNAPEIVSHYLQITGWDKLFDHIIHGSMVQNGKPAPDIYLLGAEKLGLQPEECAGIEDSVNGIRAVRAAGMTSIMIPDLVPYSDSLSPYVDLRLKDLGQLESNLISVKE